MVVRLERRERLREVDRVEEAVEAVRGRELSPGVERVADVQLAPFGGGANDTPSPRETPERRVWTPPVELVVERPLPRLRELLLTSRAMTDRGERGGEGPGDWGKEPGRRVANGGRLGGLLIVVTCVRRPDVSCGPSMSHPSDRSRLSSDCCTSPAIAGPPMRTLALTAS